MKIFLGADHRGFELKQIVVELLVTGGYAVEDMGATEKKAADDYIDYAMAVAERIGTSDRGILLCGSGHGMDIVANRYRHIRAILGFTVAVVVQGREHEDANVLVIPADYISEVSPLVRAFLETDFSNDARHIRRLEKLERLP